MVDNDSRESPGRGFLIMIAVGVIEKGADVFKEKLFLLCTAFRMKNR